MTQTDLGYLLNRAARILRLALGEALADLELRPQQAAVLMALSRGGRNPMTPSALAAAIETDTATTSGLLERLVRDGWLSSTPNPGDRRSRLFSLTSKASATLPQVFVAAEGVSTRALEGFTAEEVKTLKSLLGRLGDGVDQDHAAATAGREGDAR